MFIFLILCFTFFLVLVYISKKNTSPYLQIVKKKVEAAGYSTYKIKMLAEELENKGFSIENIEDLDALQINDSGETYGPDALHADLISVVYENSKNGYIKRKDFQKVSEDSSITTNSECSVPVYACDGKTKIGYFYFTFENEQ